MGSISAEILLYKFENSDNTVTLQSKSCSFSEYGT